MSEPHETAPQRRKSAAGLWVRIALWVIPILVVFALIYALLGAGNERIAPGTTFTARQGDLEITVQEGGSVEALASQEIRSEIEGREGVKILHIVDEGYLVTREDVATGKVLVELDSSALQEQLVNQEIDVQSDRATYIEKRAQYDIQINQNQSNITAAELRVKFALMDFEKFLGRRAVSDIVDALGLREKAAKLTEMRGAAIAETEDHQEPAMPEIDKGIGERPAWTSGEGGPPRDREWPRETADGGQERQGPGRTGGTPGGGGMDPERFRQMIEANGGQIPDRIADRIREMGMNPDMLLERMGIRPAEEEPRPAEAPEPDGSIEVTPSIFAMDEAYREARNAIDFSTFANVDKLEDGEAKQQLRQYEDNLLVAEEDLKLAQNELQSKERLAARNFVTQNELDSERVNVQKAAIRLDTAKTELNLYIEYTFPKEAERLLSDYEEALMNLERTMQEARAKLSQAEAGLRSAERRLNLETVELRRIQSQIEKCTIRAERPGMVVYGSSNDSPWRRSNEDPIQEGTTVRERQSIITIPDMTQMGVKVDVHESSVQKIARGQKARIRVDAFPDRQIMGTVEQVAVLADSANMFMNPDLKVYPTKVRVDAIHDWLRPGMSAEVEILVETLRDVIYIPIQSVSYSGDKQICYVVDNGEPRRRVIETGAFSEDFIQVVSGLEAGEEVLLLAPGTGDQDEGQEPEPGPAAQTPEPA